MNVFVLSTGRAGSKTFAIACQHLTNFTAEHELKANQVGPSRFEFPDNHIEVDNRLTWHLGLLGQHYAQKDVLYVHLKRDAEKTTQSFLHRWENSTYRASIIRAFAHGIVMQRKDWTKDQRVEVCRHYIDTISANIEEFIKDRPRMTVHLEDGGASFEAFLQRIEAKGNIEKCKAEWSRIHNAR
jgi:hypothetical protein